MNLYLQWERAISVKMIGLAGKTAEEITRQTIKIDRTMLWLYKEQIIRDVLKTIPESKTNLEKTFNDIRKIYPQTSKHK